MKKSEISIIGGLLLALAVTFATDINFQAQEIRDTTLRLHIIARDNSAHSRNIKLQVKDVINNLCSSLYFDAEDFDDAVQITHDNLEYIQQVTNNALENLQAGYSAQCSVEQFYFDTTQYEDFTMPRGQYTALTIRLGEAKGTNWWCVVYPSLCAGIGAEYEEDTANTFIETDDFRIKFKTVELWEDMKYFFSKDKVEKYDKIS